MWKITHEEPRNCLLKLSSNPDIFINRTWSDDTWCSENFRLLKTTEMRYVWGNPEGTIADVIPSSTIKINCTILVLYGYKICTIR